MPAVMDLNVIVILLNICGVDLGKVLESKELSEPLTLTFHPK